MGSAEAYLTTIVTRSAGDRLGEGAARQVSSEAKHTRGGPGLPSCAAVRLVRRAYGTLIVVPSPDAETVNVPAAGTGAYA
jgi:hypothetical protein